MKFGPAALLLSAYNFSSLLDIPAPPAREILPGHQSLSRETWQRQLDIPDRIGDHWIYLSGNLSCSRPSGRCNISDHAMLDVVEHHQQYPPPDRPSMAYIDCDAEPILCHSWLATPPSLMFISVQNTSQVDSPTARNVTMRRPFKLPIQNTTNLLYKSDSAIYRSVEATAILGLMEHPEVIEVWDGLMNPFIGMLGKRGGSVVYAFVKYHLPWLPINTQTIIMAGLLLVRLLIKLYGPSTTPQVSAADMILRPGALDTGEDHPKEE